MSVYLLESFLSFVPLYKYLLKHKKMENFAKKIDYVWNFFMYKFKYHDARSHKIKIYLISPDEEHLYMSVDMASDGENKFHFEIGNLYIDKKFNKLFEDNPKESFKINKRDFNFFKKKTNKIQEWEDKLFNDLNKIYINSDVGLVF